MKEDGDKHKDLSPSTNLESTNTYFFNYSSCLPALGK